MTVKNPPAMQETWVESLPGSNPSLGQEDSLEKGMARPSGILAKLPHPR